ncbi:acyltransferase family protein [Sphingobacterium bambusae]|uniref:Acyltransferase family protein n=1 Tax=Sphingobacterium bambusae TaxID=662858 RepID=A0ABW6BC38_9SPHI|nr:acyltransferase family protein [Sphingobacterium bambusae]WPL46980.1 acyltransferase family protein [Sphingobacterium bambusae]
MITENALQKQSEMIDMLRFPLIILVVFVHMAPSEQQMLSWNLDGHSLFLSISEIVSHHIGQLAVPFFFVFSGYFFFLKSKSWSFSTYTDQLGKRVKTLLIPYIFWNVIIVAIIVTLQVSYTFLGLGINANYRVLQINTVFDLFWGLPINIPLWYIRDLMVMVVLSPLFYYFFNTTKYVGLLVLVLFYLSAFESGFPGLGSTAIMYFGLGTYMGVYKVDARPFCLRYGKLFLFLAVLFLLLDLYFINHFLSKYFYRAFLLCILPAIYFAAIKSAKGGRLTKKLISLAPTVFFIYAVHTIYFLDKLKALWLKTPMSASGWGMLIGYLLIPFMCIGVILLVYYVFKKFLPSVLAFATGSRA